ILQQKKLSQLGRQDPRKTSGPGAITKIKESGLKNKLRKKLGLPPVITVQSNGDASQQPNGDVSHDDDAERQAVIA
ncbi:unnamed protein product, partial [Darwinula stevensoni]